MRGLALNLASTHQTENPRVPHVREKVGENKQLLIAIVVRSFFISIVCFSSWFSLMNIHR
ncbi:hypothetical protein DMZ48_10545 [Robertkochia solimangrovi]|nr:hypothetical protein DMZ48_10545 [Robertkochia solimangrovi]